MTGARAGAPERALVAIDGLDGSGKSQFARALAAACELEQAGPVVLLHVDDFRRPLSPPPPGVDEAAHYYDAYYDYGLLDACLERFLAGAPEVTIPRFDPATERLDGTKVLSFAGARLAILEGVFVLRVTSVTRDSSLIVLDVTEDEARRRVMARDLARGRSPEVVEYRMNYRYFPAQRRYRAALAPALRADVVIDNERWERPRIVRTAPDRLPPVVARSLARVVRS